MNGTDNIEIESICKKLGLEINPVLTKDMIPKDIDGWTIFNTQDYDNDIIGHFCCFYKAGDSIPLRPPTDRKRNCGENLYFDSFGFVPCLAVEEILKPNFIYNHKQIQNVNSKACGMFCIALVKYCNEYGNTFQSLRRFCEMFSTNTSVNDAILRKQFAIRESSL